MIQKIAEVGGVELKWDTNESLYYLKIQSGCTQDFTKEELIDVLKELLSDAEDL